MLEILGSTPRLPTINLYNMEVEEKIVKTKKKEKTQESTKMEAICAGTIRGIIKLVNEKGIKKENIVSILRENSQVVLIYYK